MPIVPAYPRDREAVDRMTAYQISDQEVEEFMREEDLANMRNNHVIAASLLAVLTVAGCAEVQRASEDIARQSGNPRLAGAIHGVGNVVGSLFPIGYEEESSIGQAMALQVVARYGGVVDQPGWFGM